MNGDLATLRARIHLRLIQLGIDIPRRTRIISVVNQVKSAPRLTAFVIRLEGRFRAGQPLWRMANEPLPSPLRLQPLARRKRAPALDETPR